MLGSVRNSGQMDEGLLLVQSQPTVKILKPVWLFRDDIVGVAERLIRIGPLEVSTDKVRLDIPGLGNLHDCTEVWKNRPIRWLWFSLLKDGVSVASVVVHPTHVELRRSYDWDPSEAEADVIAQVQNSLRSRRHILFFLGERGWQLAFTLVALVLLLSVAALSLRGTSSLLLVILGIVLGVPVAFWIIAGRFLPSRSHVTLSALTQREFWQRARRIILCVVSGTIIWICGFAAALAAIWIGRMRGF